MGELTDIKQLLCVPDDYNCLLVRELTLYFIIAYTNNLVKSSPSPTMLPREGINQLVFCLYKVNTAARVKTQEFFNLTHRFFVMEEAMGFPSPLLCAIPPRMTLGLYGPSSFESCSFLSPSCLRSAARVALVSVAAFSAFWRSVPFRTCASC